ncbi:hypothetical protein ACQR09_32235, partial [Bradyrhizobium oligotrophicum]|uniref:hypothetical protein n=1 Tax=Bradyrhizobium oligotrophicum TaxID=44255 RepID=UPI003EB9958D
RFRFISPSFVKADSKSFWRKFLGAGHIPCDQQTAAPENRFLLRFQADHPCPDLPRKIFNFRLIRICD